VLSIDRLIRLKGVIKWNAVFAEAGLNPNTMRSAVHHHRELREEEASAITEVLARNGLILAPEKPRPKQSDRAVGKDASPRPTLRVPAGNHG